MDLFKLMCFINTFPFLFKSTVTQKQSAMVSNRKVIVVGSKHCTERLYMVVFTKAQLPGSSMSLASTETGSGCPRDKNTERKQLITHKQHCTSCKSLPHCFVLGTEETLNLCAVINSKNRLIKKKNGENIAMYFPMYVFTG